MLKMLSDLHFDSASPVQGWGIAHFSQTTHRFHCPNCRRRFAGASFLERHFELRHRGQKLKKISLLPGVFSCYLCRKEYASFNKLLNHELTAHQDFHKSYMTRSLRKLNSTTPMITASTSDADSEVTDITHPEEIEVDQPRSRSVPVDIQSEGNGPNAPVANTSPLDALLSNKRKSSQPQKRHLQDGFEIEQKIPKTISNTASTNGTYKPNRFPQPAFPFPYLPSSYGNFNGQQHVQLPTNNFGNVIPPINSQFFQYCPSLVPAIASDLRHIHRSNGPPSAAVGLPPIQPPGLQPQWMKPPENMAPSSSMYGPSRFMISPTAALLASPSKNVKPPFITSPPRNPNVPLPYDCKNMAFMGGPSFARKTTVQTTTTTQFNTSIASTSQLPTTTPAVKAPATFTDPSMLFGGESPRYASHGDISKLSLSDFHNSIVRLACQLHCFLTVPGFDAQKTARVFTDTLLCLQDKKRRNKESSAGGLGPTGFEWLASIASTSNSCDIKSPIHPAQSVVKGMKTGANVPRTIKATSPNQDSNALDLRVGREK